MYQLIWILCSGILQNIELSKEQYNCTYIHIRYRFGLRNTKECIIYLHVYKCTYIYTYDLYTANSIKVILKKRSNMSTKGLSGMTSLIPEHITIHRFSTKIKIKPCSLMNTNVATRYP